MTVTRVTSLLLLCTAVAPLAMGPRADTTLRFYWAAQLATGSREQARYALIEGDRIQVRNGDRLQFYVVPAADAFIYILHSGSDGVEMLFPSATGADPVKGGQQQYVPSKEGWFAVDGPAGREFLYLLASTERLATLEATLVAHARAAKGARKASAAAVLDEIATLRRDRMAPERPASRPMAIAGSFRATAPDLAAVAREITAGAFYARAYVVDHK